MAQVDVKNLQLTLSSEEAWALCNVLTCRNESDKKGLLMRVNIRQLHKLSDMGRELGKVLDHPSKYNVDPDTILK